MTRKLTKCQELFKHHQQLENDYLDLGRDHEKLKELFDSQQVLIQLLMNELKLEEIDKEKVWG